MSTLSSTFFLKHPKGNKESLILFSCYFKFEERKFVYSTGEKIKPEHPEKVLNLFDALDDNDDVNNIYANADI